MNHVDVIVIGAGAAGLFCAATAGARGRRVWVVDHANKAGKKILMSGGGKCNFTNYDITPENYLCANPHFCKSALQRYTQWDFLALVDRYGITYHEKSRGQLFCGDDPKAKGTAKHILRMLLDECAAHSVHVKLNTSIKNIEFTDEQGQYVLTMQQGDSIQTVTCTSLVVATGGLSIPTMGATGFGYQVAQQFGIPTLPTRAGLVPYYLNDRQREQLANLSGMAIPVTVACNEQSFAEDMLFTHRGLSGPAALQISSYWQSGDAVEIDLLPEIDLAQALKDWRQTRAKAQLNTVLSQHMHKKIVATFLGVYFPDVAERTMAELSNDTLDAVANCFNRWLVKPPSTEGYRTAEVTLGGVDTDAISSKTFEAKKQPGLFFIGEVLDVTGWLGGYNFQWAWASGYCAGQYV